MSEDQRPPQQAVKSYPGGIAARNAERQAAKREQGPLLPNLGQAAVSYDPRNPQTLQQIAETQRADAPDLNQEKGLSGGTVEGLRALHAAAQGAQAAKAAPTPAPAPTQAQEPLPVADDDNDPIDEEFEKALQEAKQNVIQNELERQAVAKRVKEIDLADGLISGGFTQLVPIVPGKLDVKYRSLTPLENNELRMLLFDEIQADPRKARLTQELLALYQTVAAVMSLNKTTYADHLVPDGEFGRISFSVQVFAEKVRAFMSFPIPLIIALSTHSAWFDMRVRDMFVSTDRLKNG